MLFWKIEMGIDNTTNIQNKYLKSLAGLVKYYNINGNKLGMSNDLVKEYIKNYTRYTTILIEFNKDNILEAIYKINNKINNNYINI